MKHAILLAHPDRASFNGAIARAYARAARELGHEVLKRDLYAMKFDPCLKAEEISGPDVPRFAGDVMTERHLLEDVDVFAFFYPLWFNGPPAILKGYVDRVFSMGFGFEPAPGGMAPGLEGRRLISFTTSGAPDFWVRDTGALEALKTVFDRHLAGVCGLSFLDHINFGGIVAGLREDVIDEVFDQVRNAVRRHFAPA